MLKNFESGSDWPYDEDNLALSQSDVTIICILVNLIDKIRFSDITYLRVPTFFSLTWHISVSQKPYLYLSK